MDPRIIAMHRTQALREQEVRGAEPPAEIKEPLYYFVFYYLGQRGRRVIHEGWMGRREAGDFANRNCWVGERYETRELPLAPLTGEAGCYTTDAG